MKKVMKDKDKVGISIAKDDDYYYHMFCAFSFGHYLDVVNLKELKVKKEYRNTMNKLNCIYCNEKSGICLSCSTC